jgi:hypothetical protein
MKDKSIIWISAGGMVCWLFAGYAPARAMLVGLVRAIVNEVMSVF